MSTPKIHILHSPHSKKPNSSSRLKGYRWLWIFLGLGGVAVVSAVAGALVAVAIASTPLLQSQLSPEDEQVFEQGDISTNMDFRLPELTRPVNILVLGVKVLSSDLSNPPEEVRDLGYDALVDSFEGLSDTMMLLQFNPSTGQVVVLSLPRDTRTYVEDVGTTKLNSANVYGGPALTATAVSDLLGGITIDRYVRINVQGVEKLIDALGGVTVYIPKDMDYEDDAQHLYIHLKKGEHHLNGNQALQFLRFRHDENGDIGRVQRQQMFMRAFMEQTLNPTTLTRLPRILSVIQENVDTNLSIEELVALVGFASQTQRSNVQMLLLPGEFSSPGAYDLSYWIPSPRGIEAMMAQYFMLEPSDSAEYETSLEEGIGLDEETDYESEVTSRSWLSVAIQDSTGNEASVEALIDSLNEAGYGNVYIDEDWSEPLTTTRIVAQRGDVTSAEAVQQTLGIGEVRVESTGSLRSDVTIQLGQDWVEVAPVEEEPVQTEEETLYE